MGFLSQVPELKTALGISGILSFYGIVTVIMYFLPVEKWGYNNTQKIVIIALVLLTLPIALIGVWLISRRKRKEEKAKVESEAKVEEKSNSAPQQLARPAGNYDDISQAAEETVQFLRSSNLGGGKDAVYELPWYLVIGNPKSGKSSLSLASGLNFQTLPSQRQSEQKFIRPTRNIDWRVTSDAVFLDTAGRYQLESDQDEWAGLLETLKKYRGNRPLDGMIVSVSVERVLHSDENDIEQMAKVMRARIDETIQRTKLRFPVYLVFTHADSIEGFRDSFSNSQKEGENLVWGATIPLEKSENAHALFDEEYDLLQKSIMKRRLMRLSSPFPPVRQLKIFNFPLHFGSARKKLGHFVATLFRPNPFSESPLLRGFYFTAVPVNRPKVDGGQTMTNVGQTVGQSYFTRKLFRDVILRDKNMVASFLSQKVSPPIMGWLLTFFGAILAFALLLGSGISLYKNKLLVQRASKEAEIVLTMVRADQNRSPLDKNPAEAEEEIKKIEALKKSLAELDKYEREGAPILMRFGLYSGNRIYREKLLPIYYSAIEQRFKKPIVKKLETDLQAFAANANASDKDVLDKNFALFSTYLMLSREQVNPNITELGTYRDHAEPTTLFETLKPYLLSECKVPESMVETANQQLDFYFQQVKREEFPGIKLDSNLVEASRKKLQAYPAWAKYYRRVTTEISNKVPKVNVDTILAGKGGGQGVLTGNYTVPGAYTIDGYQKYMLAAIDKAAVPGELNKDDWVMGGKDKKDQVDPQAVQEIRNEYFKAYINNWKKFISSIDIPGYEGKKENAVNALTVFSDVKSPMITILDEVSRQTNLSAEPASQSWLDPIWKFFGAGQNVKKEKTPVEEQFEALFKFTESKDGKPSELSNYGNIYGTILKCSNPDCNFEKLELSEITKQVQEQKGAFVKLLNDADKSMNSVTGGFKSGTVGPEIAILLRKPLNNLNELVGGGIKKEIEKAWAEIFAKAQTIEKGYPFTNDGEADLTELTKYLNPVNGTLSDFYTKRLQKYFEGEAPNLKVKEGSEIKFSDDFVKYLNNAFRLREALFGKNATPLFKYELKLQKSNDATIEIKIDHNNPVDTTATLSGILEFPSTGNETGALIRFASDSTTANSPTPPVSNTNTAPVGVQNQTNTGSGSRPYPGRWGLFKFFEDGAPKKQPTGEYLLTYKVGGKTISATIRPTGGDLFDRETYFKSVRATQTIFK